MADALADREARVDAALADYLQALDRGQAPPRNEFLARHAELAVELDEFLNDLSRFQVGTTPRAIDTPPVPGNMATATHDKPVAAEAPISLGPVQGYEILGELGRGGMGAVYKARQVSINRLVALKTVSPDRLETRADRDRFLREAEAAATLDHPNIVPIYEVGEACGRAYFTMKLLERGSLADHKDALQKNARGAAELVAVVARAVHYAHQRGILHRDLKPSNILLGPAGEPLVADFGLAKRLDTPAEASKSGVVVGTPAYMAPEQARGAKGLSTAADLYGLGAVLYELLTGRPPFQAPSAAETLVLVLGAEPVRPRSLNSEVPTDLEAICLKCLAKDPGQRYASAEALADDLDHWRAGEPISARPARPAERAVKWVRRNPALAALATVGAVAVAAVIWAAAAAAYNSDLTAAKLRLESTNRGLVEANERRDAALGELARNSAEAERLQVVAEGERENARRLLYVARFRQAEQAWRDGRPALASQLLFDSPEAAGLHRFAGAEQLLSGIGRARVRAVQVQSVRPRMNEPAEPTQTVRMCHFTTDGKLVFLIKPDTSMSWWDTETGSLRGQTGGVWGRPVGGVRMTDTHTLVAVSGPRGGALKILDHRLCRLPVSPFAMLLDRQKTSLVIPVEKDIALPDGVEVLEWDVSRDGRRVAAGCGDGVLRVWSVPQGLPVAEIAGFGKDRVPVALSADGTRVLRGGAEPAVWKLGTSEPEWVIPKREPIGIWRAVTFGPDEKLVAAATEQAVELWYIGSGAPFNVVRQAAVATKLEAGPDGRSVMAVWADRRATVFDRWGRPLADFVPDRPPLFAARLVENGALFASGGRERPLDVSHVEFGQRESSIISVSESAHSVDLSPNGDRVVATLRDGSVEVWTASDSKRVCTLQARTQSGYSRAVFSPCGRKVAVGAGNDVAICDASNGRVLSKLPAQMKGGLANIYDVAFSPDGKLLAAGTANAASVWDLATGQTIHHLSERPPPGAQAASWMVSIRFSPNSQLLATGSGSWDQDGTGRSCGYAAVWDLKTGQQVFVSRGVPDGIYGLAWSPDSRLLATGGGRYQFGGPGVINVWDPTTGRLAFDFRGHAQCVWALAFAPDGRRLISAGGQWRPSFGGRTAKEEQRQNPAPAGEVRVWALDTGQELLNARLHTDTAYGLAFSSDGKRLATAGWDKVIRVWNAAPEPEDVAGLMPRRDQR